MMKVSDSETAIEKSKIKWEKIEWKKLNFHTVSCRFKNLIVLALLIICCLVSLSSTRLANADSSPRSKKG